MRNRYLGSFKVWLKLGGVAQLERREMRSQVWIYQSLCAENAQNGTKAIRL